MSRHTPLIMACLVLMIIASCTSAAKVQEEQRYLRSIARDRIITTTIFKSLIADDLTAQLNITPRCYDGKAYLVGMYAREEQKERALELARTVEGVRSVDAYLVPATGESGTETCSTEEDLRLSGAVKSHFQKRLSHIKTSRMDVISVRCVVVLVGIVRTDREITALIETARGTDGVREVVSYLRSLEQET